MFGSRVIWVPTVVSALLLWSAAVAAEDVIYVPGTTASLQTAISMVATERGWPALRFPAAPGLKNNAPW